MKCPKCQYISFESSDRCRNCGYEFSLASTAGHFDLPIQTGDEAVGPLSDFALEREKSDLGRTASAGPMPALSDFAPTPHPRPITNSFDLPLFKERRRDEDAPLVTPSAVPRAPLSVRRTTPAPRGGNPPTDELRLDLGAAATLETPRVPVRAPLSPSAIEEILEPGAETDQAVAAVLPRVLAALVDILILGSIGSLVLYLTLKVCGLQFARLTAIPPVPFLAFLVMIAGGYLTLFTAAGGQTIGKMAAGIRVVSSDAEQSRVPLGHAVIRAAAYLVSALPAGLGFVPALFGGDRRALHDRIADTRVVKA